MHISSPRQGFTLIELLVVISIIATLAIMLSLMSRQDPRLNGAHRKPNCGNNQRQIVLGMLIYANDYKQAWPVLMSIANNAAASYTTPTTGLQFASITMNSFEFLAYTSGGDLNYKIFTCPSNMTIKPPVANVSAAAVPTVSGTWSAAVGSTAFNVQAYAYDWSAPSNSTSVRVITADRPKNWATTGDFTNHKSVAMAAFADGHVANINKSTTAALGTNRTLAQDNVANAWTGENKDANGTVIDNIYDDYSDADGTSQVTAGGGSTSRAYVK
jgi:prepilin-type N-terminal cleavage/methylation domain-containing protein/prepilin-type processing-associated H-X9-DG protein